MDNKLPKAEFTGLQRMHDGSHLITHMINDQYLYTQRFTGYGMKEAMRLAKESANREAKEAYQFINQ
jgi:hypothetical protein